MEARKAKGGIVVAAEQKGKQTGSPRQDARGGGWVSAAIEWYCRKITKSPCWTYLAVLSIVLVLVACASFAPNVSLSEQSEYDWVMSDTATSRDADALKMATAMADPVATATGGPNGGAAPSLEEQEVLSRTEASGRYSLTFTYEWKDGRDGLLFTPSTVQQMCEVENLVLGHPDFPHWCWATNETKASSPTGKRQCHLPSRSVLSYFYTRSDFDDSAGYGPLARHCTLLPQSTIDDGVDRLMTDVRGENTRLMAGFFAGHDSLDTGYTRVTRSAILVGQPLDGYKSADDEHLAQRKLYHTFIEDVEKDILAYFGMEHTMFRSAYRDPATTKDLKVRVFNMEIINFEFDRIVNGDSLWTFASIVFVFAYLWVHTTSGFLASVSLLQIVLSLPLALTWYGAVGRVPYITQLHILAMFLVLGVGADDAFVFVDGWQQAKNDPTLVTEHDRLVFTYRHTMKAVFNTSFTTTVAFASTALSPIMPVSSFGIWAALCIINNYIFVITLTPAAVIVWERYFLGRKCCCCCGARKPAAGEGRDGRYGGDGDASDATPVAASAPTAGPVVSDIESQTTMTEVDLTVATPTLESKMDASTATPRSESDTGLSGEEPQLRPIERFFAHVYAPFLNYAPKSGPLRKVKVVSWVIVLAFSAFVTVMAVAASKLSTPPEQEQWFPDDHMYTGIESFFSDNYLSAEAENYITVSMMWGVKGLDRSEYDVWIPHENRGTPIWDPAFDLGNPAAQQSIMDVCTNLATLPCNEPGCGNTQKTLALNGASSVECFLQDYLTWYRSNSTVDSNAPMPTGDAFLTSLAQYRNTPEGQPYMTSIGFVQGKLKYVVVRVTTSLLKQQPNGVTKPVFDVVQAYVNQVRDAAPPSAASVLQSAGEWWTWMTTEAGLVSSMFQGLAICFPMAFLVLIGATGNVLLSLYATVSIAAIVVCVLGFVQAVMGWSLGAAESIAAVIVVGFAVDYTIHLGHMYHECMHTSRGLRVKHSATTMGVTVFAGAITTFGSGSFMMGCQLTFYTKMSVLICATIIFSFIASLGFFLALCAIVGPEGSTGDVTDIMRVLGAAFCGRRQAVAAPGAPATGSGAPAHAVSKGKGDIELTTNAVAGQP